MHHGRRSGGFLEPADFSRDHRGPGFSRRRIVVVAPPHAESAFEPSTSSMSNPSYPPRSGSAGSSRRFPPEDRDWRRQKRTEGVRPSDRPRSGGSRSPPQSGRRPGRWSPPPVPEDSFEDERVPRTLDGPRRSDGPWSKSGGRHGRNREGGQRCSPPFLDPVTTTRRQRAREAEAAAAEAKGGGILGQVGDDGDVEEGEWVEEDEEVRRRRRFQDHPFDRRSSWSLDEQLGSSSSSRTSGGSWTRSGHPRGRRRWSPTKDDDDEFGDFYEAGSSSSSTKNPRLEDSFRSSTTLVFTDAHEVKEVKTSEMVAGKRVKGGDRREDDEAEEGEALDDDDGGDAKDVGPDDVSSASSSSSLSLPSLDSEDVPGRRQGNASNSKVSEVDKPAPAAKAAAPSFSFSKIKASCEFQLLDEKMLNRLSGTHPVSALHELCQKLGWPGPILSSAFEFGPPNSKMFIFKADVNGQVFQPAVAVDNKKDAKANAAMFALQEMGFIVADINNPL